MSEGYKMTDLGEIPTEWGISSLDDIKEDGSTISYGVVQPGHEEDNGILFIRGGDVKNGKIGNNLRTISKQISDQYKRTILKGGELLVSLVGYPGECAIVPNVLAGANIARQVGMIRIKKQINSAYIQQYLNSPIGKKNLLGNLVGSAQQVINLDMLRKVKVPLPSSEEQKIIAEILYTVDEKIEVIEAQIAQTSELKKGLMQQLLTKGIGHSQFKASPLGEIPESWEVKELDDISDITRLAGYEYSEYWQEDSNGTIQTLRGYNIGKNKIILKDIVRISDELSMKLIRSRLFKGDVVFPCVGTIGNAAVIDEDNKFHINQNIAKITPYTTLHSFYLVQYLISDLCRKEIDRFNATTSQPNVLVGSLRKFRVPFPPDIEEQRKIADILSTVDKKLDMLQEKKASYQELKKGLMQQLLTGKIRVHQTNKPHERTEPRRLQPAVEG